MELPKNEAVFEVSIEGDTTFKRYEGQFTVRCVLTMGQKHAMEMDKTRLLGNYNYPTDSLAGLAEIFANLKAKVVDGPEWWKQSLGGTSIKDENVLIDVYNKAQEAEKTWRQKVQEMAKPKENPSEQPSQP